VLLLQEEMDAVQELCKVVRMHKGAGRALGGDSIETGAGVRARRRKEEEGPPDVCHTKTLKMLNEHAMQIVQGRALALQFADLAPFERPFYRRTDEQHTHEGEDGETEDEGEYDASVEYDTLAFDFAPSFNFHVDRFEFGRDRVYSATAQAIRFIDAIEAEAERVAMELFPPLPGGKQQAPYGAIHLRRDGYEGFCFGSGLKFYDNKRFGLEMNPKRCFPSVQVVLPVVL
jgi:hypothetical protein